MEIKAVKKEEYGLTEELVYEAFKRTSFSDGIVEKELVKEMREKPFYIPELDLAAVENGEIIGCCLFTKFPISQKHQEEILLLAPVAVAVHKQQCGIGTAMLKKGIKMAADMGYKGIIVEGDNRYYQRFGFRTSIEFGIYASEKNLPPKEENLMAMELFEGGLKTITGEVDYSIYQSLITS